MTAEEWKQVRAVFDNALRRDPEERGAFLDEACAGNPRLRSEVTSLLDAHDRAGHFMEAPDARLSADLTAGAPADWATGRVVGPYILRHELGRGGMGVVYLADDTRLSRRVALKALAPGVGREPGRRERLRQEARAAAGVIHRDLKPENVIRTPAGVVNESV
jgi:serine/threonine-protein kinase